MTDGSAAALAGSGASTPLAHTPAVSLSSRPWPWPELSVYRPAAAQFPGEAHDTELTEKGTLPVWVPASAGSDACTPVAHTPAVSVNSTP